MPRQRRLIFPGVAVHVVQRGNNRMACFRGDSDYRLYLLYLRELSKRHGCAIHAYCLMTNHVHLLLTPDSAFGCAALMQNLGQRYVQYFNRAYGRSGTLWEGRFRSCAAESAAYVLACYRYIELNPVRAGIVERPGQYAWSSYRANAEGGDDPLVSPHSEYAALGRNRETVRAAYRGLFDMELEPMLVSGIREATNGGYPLASDRFKAQVTKSTTRRLERGRPGRPVNRKQESDEKTPEIGL